MKTSMSGTEKASVSEGDGRTARSQRTRDAIVAALHALIGEGDAKPGAGRIAERAGVSTRTVFAHFSSLEDLHCASVERATALVISMLTPIDPDQPVADRIDSLCAQRARVNEEVGPIRRAAALRAPFSRTLARARDNGRRASYEQIDRVFAHELDTLDPATHRRRRAAVDAVVSGEVWDLLRSAHDLSPDEARTAMAEAVERLLATAPPSGAPASSRPAAGDDRARVEAAQRAVADIEQKVERLVAAIEAGSPADLLAPRLQALRAAKRSAEQHLADTRQP